MRDASRMTMEWNLGMRTIHGFIYTLRLYERGVRETLGRYTGFVMPGLGFQIPLAHITRVGSVQALKKLDRIENSLRNHEKSLSRSTVSAQPCCWEVCRLRCRLEMGKASN